MTKQNSMERQMDIKSAPELSAMHFTNIPPLKSLVVHDMNA